MSPTTSQPVTDLNDLTGFKDHGGIRVAAVGDDGEQMIALGHHDDRALAAAFAHFARQDLGWDTDDIAVDPEPKWAVFTAESPGATNWWCDWSVAADTPGAVAVTLLDCS